jgi:hypothetical protein
MKREISIRDRKKPTLVRLTVQALNGTYTLERRISVVLGLVDTVTVSLLVCEKKKVVCC